MSQAVEHAPVALRMRPDLVVRKRQFLGQPCYLVKEPIGLKYSRLHEEEYAILDMLDGETSQHKIRESVQQRFAPLKISHLQLQQFFGSLHENGLVISGMPGQGAELWRRGNTTWWKELGSKLTNIFAIRWRGVDPDVLLSKMNRVTWLFFTWPAVLVVLAVGVWALSLLALQWEQFTLRLPGFHQFFGPGNWLYLGATIAIVKVIHEFGHGLACKRYGGECHQIGFMLLVFTPALYCDVSDAWLLDNKWKRMAISAAGIYVELFLASIATILWWYSYPGTLTNQLCLQVMFVASVSTLMFNANPLMRFDGYYILADFLEIPNLRQQSTQALQKWMMETCLGIEQPSDLFMPEKNRLWLALFTVASTIYQWVVVFSIAWFLSRLLEPYGLKIIGQMITLAGIIGMVASPSWRLYRYLSAPGRLREVKPAHLITTLIIAGLIIAALFVPLPRYVSCVCEAQPANAVTMYVEGDGVLTDVAYHPGDAINAGDAIGKVVNLALEIELTELQAKSHQAKTRLANLRRQRFARSEAALELDKAASEFDSIRTQIKEKSTQKRHMTINAAASGVIIPVNRPPQKTSDSLPAWSGSLLQEKNKDAPVRKGDVVCRIGDPNTMEAVLIIDQTDIDLAQLKQPVWIQFDAYPGQLLESQIEEISELNLTSASPSLSVQAGGGLPTEAGEAGDVKPASPSYGAKAPLSEDGKSLQAGLRGKAKIYIGNRSLAWRAHRWFMKTFHFDA